MASIDKRPDGTYRVRWREYTGGPQKTRSFRRKVDAANYRARVEHDLMVGCYITPEAAQVTLEPYIAAHLARQPWRASTKEAATNALVKHALKFFGDRPLGSVRKADVQAFVVGLPLAPSTVRTVFQHLYLLLNAAVEDRLIVANPAKGVRLPQSGKGEIVPPTAEEVQALYDAAPAWFRTAVLLGAGLGLRQGEVMGLSADRVDWLGGRSVRIDRQWDSRRPPGHFAPPKSPSSNRTVPVADSVLAALGAVVTHRDGFIFHEHDDHSPVGHHRFDYVWRQTVKRSGLEPGLRFHVLRHRFASVLISEGCSIVAVQRAMGHSSAAITLGLYGHLMPSDADRVRLAVERSLQPAPGPASAAQSSISPQSVLKPARTNETR